MSKRYVSSIEVLEHGNTFVAEELRGLRFSCPECNEKLDPSNVIKAEPNTRHTVSLGKESVFVATVFCPECGCEFRATVKEK